MKGPLMKYEKTFSKKREIERERERDLHKMSNPCSCNDLSMGYLVVVEIPDNMNVVVRRNNSESRVERRGMADKMGNPFQLLSSRLVGMWSFSRLEMQQEAMTAWHRVLWFCINYTVSICQFIWYRLPR